MHTHLYPTAGGGGIWWTAQTACGGTGHLGRTETQRGRLWTACGQRRVDSKNSQTTQYANYWAPLTRKGHTPCHIQHSRNTPTTGLHERGNDTSRSTGRSGRQKAATRRNMRREERVTVQGPVKKQQPDGMSHRGVPPLFTPRFGFLIRRQTQWLTTTASSHPQRGRSASST